MKVLTILGLIALLALDKIVGLCTPFFRQDREPYYQRRRKWFNFF